MLLDEQVDDDEMVTKVEDATTDCGRQPAKRAHRDEASGSLLRRARGKNVQFEGELVLEDLE